ncbi:MAG: diadenylate cyclase CdaA [Thermodesulfobacteriota bacterium]|jgi:diadenylate cyclase
MNGFWLIFQNIRWQDVLDVLVVAFIIYQIFLLIKGTRAVQILIGMVVIFVAFLIARRMELLTLHWILSNFLGSIILVIIILFKTEIRRVLAQVGRSPFVRTPAETLLAIEEVITAAVYLSSHLTGALIVLERQTGLNDQIRSATMLDARVSWELLVSIFHPQSPIHDGGVIIQNNKITAAGCYFPLTRNTKESKSYGSRHRAALGLSEEADAAVVVVSEETGRISVAINGRFTRGLDSTTLKRVLQTLFAKERGRRTYWLFGPRKPLRSKGERS